MRLGQRIECQNQGTYVRVGKGVQKRPVVKIESRGQMAARSVDAKAFAKGE